MIRRALYWILIPVLLISVAQAHEMRPAYLELRETAANTYSVLWKVPAAGDKRLGLYVRMPVECKTLAGPAGSITGGAFYERWSVACDNGLEGREIAIDGLRTTLTDVLARVAYGDGTTQVTRLTPQQPVLRVAGSQSMLAVANTYFWLGVDHILAGTDHLLFVLALLLLIRDPWMLVKTITAFTVAHSITLAGAALGFLSLPQKPVEAVIALSIAFVARELAIMAPSVLDQTLGSGRRPASDCDSRTQTSEWQVFRADAEGTKRQSQNTSERRLSEVYPWIVAFAFGLLHGFGFAGALKEIGLPQIDVPLALLMFNLGVEAGQLLFVAGLVVAFRVLTVAFSGPIAPARLAAAYAIGITSCVWLVSRVSEFWS